MQFPDCDAYLAAGFLVVHRHTKHDVDAGGIQQWETPPYGYSQTYRMSFPTTAGLREFPVKGSRGQAATRTVLGVYFFHIYGRDTVVISEEVKLTHPQCPHF